MSKKQQRLAQATRMYRRTLVGTAWRQLTRAYWVTISGFVRADRLLRYLTVRSTSDRDFCPTVICLSTCAPTARSETRRRASAAELPRSHRWHASPHPPPDASTCRKTRSSYS